MTLFIIIRFIYEAYFRFPHFKILKVEVRSWRKKSREKLTSYQIELKTKKPSTELVFEELWIDEKRYKFNLSREDRKIAGSFDKKEILKINIFSELLHEADPENPVRSSKGRLLLSYTFRNKRKFVSIKKFSDFDEIRLSGNI